MTGPTDIEIERAIEALNNNHWHIVADMMLALKARAKAAEKRVLPPEPTDAMLEAMWNAMFEEPFDATALPMLGAGYDALRAALEAKP